MYTREIPAFGGISLTLRGKGALGAPFRAPAAPVLGVACGAHNFKYVRRVMRIPNMCLVLKLDNGKVVSIANEQTE